MSERVDVLEMLRVARRAAGDMRKVFLALYGLLIFVPVALLVVAGGRVALSGTFTDQLARTFLRPVQATFGLFGDAFAEGAWGLMALVLLGIWLVAMLVGSFFGLAITRMAAVEITCSVKGPSAPRAGSGSARLAAIPAANDTAVTPLCFTIWPP